MSDRAALALDAPAKVNLGLRIRGRRPDGYHLLESLFVPLDLADRVEIELGSVEDGVGSAARVSLELAGEQAGGVPADGTNLAARAAAAFLAAASRPDLVASLRLVKHIPAQAGLGGGSSDAGAVLRGLCALLPDAVAPAALAALALRLGADVPFFLDPRPAIVRGIGDEVETLPAFAALSLVLVHPGIGLSTAAVYEAYDALRGALTHSPPGPTVRPVEGPLGPEALAGLLRNDLEPAALRLCPVIARLRERIEGAGAVAVGMSGSGPTLFGVFRDESSAKNAAAAVEQETRRALGPRNRVGAWVRVARTRSSQPPRGDERAGREPSNGASPNW